MREPRRASRPWPSPGPGHLERYDEDTESWETDPTGDLGRITRQQFLIRRAVGQVQALNPFTNPLTLADLLDVAVNSVGVDGGLSNDDLRDLAGRFRNFDPETMVNHALPVSGFRTSGGASVLRLDEGPEADAILNIFRGLDPGEVLPEPGVRRRAQRQRRRDAGHPHRLRARDPRLPGRGAPRCRAHRGHHHRLRPRLRGGGRPCSPATSPRRPSSWSTRTSSPTTSCSPPGDDFTTVVRQPWPEGTVEGPTTTTTSTTTTEPGETTTTSEPPTTTTTEPIGFLPEAPEGADC